MTWQGERDLQRIEYRPYTWNEDVQVVTEGDILPVLGRYCTIVISACLVTLSDTACVVTQIKASSFWEEALNAAPIHLHSSHEVFLYS